MVWFHSDKNKPENGGNNTKDLKNKIEESLDLGELNITEADLNIPLFLPDFTEDKKTIAYSNAMLEYFYLLLEQFDDLKEDEERATFLLKIYHEGIFAGLDIELVDDDD